MNTKGQVTVFVILGVVILIVASLLLVVKNISVSDNPSFEETDMSLEIKPVNEFVTSCLNQIAKQSVIELGKNGGHIELSGMRVSPLPYDSEVILFEPETIVYWNFLEDCSESFIGCLKSNRPALCEPSGNCVILDSRGENSIQSQLSEYVEINLPTCLNNFKDLKNQFSITVGELDVETYVGEGGVSFKANYPIKVSSFNSDVEETIPYFVSQLDVNLLEMYQFASEIYEAEKQTAYFGHQTLNLITAYSGMDSELLPPMNEMKLFTADKTFWVRSEVEEQLVYDVLPYMGLIQIANAQNSQTIIPPYDNTSYWQYSFGFFQSLQMKVSNNSYAIDAHVAYPFLPIYLRIGDSEIIKADQVESADDSLITKIIGFFLDDYRFKYDLSYPLIVSLKDDKSFNGEGFEFNFGLEVNLINNIPINSSINPTILSAEGGLSMNDPSQRPDRVLTIETKDKHTNEPLEDVYVYYRCGREYFIGNTRLVSGKAILESQFPFCQFGGQIRYEKPGFMGSSESYDNVEGDGTKHFSLELWPIKEKEVIIKKRTPQNIRNVENYGAGGILLLESEATSLLSDDKVIFNINRDKESSFDSDVPFIGFLAYTRENSSVGVNIADQRTNIISMFDEGLIDVETRDAYLLELENATDSLTLSSGEYSLGFVPGTYLIESYLTYEGGINLPAETKTICKGVCTGDTDDWGVCDGTCIPLSLDLDATEELELEEQTFPVWISGGANYNITLSEDDVYDSDSITFYVLEMTHPDDWDDMLTYEPVEDYQIGKEYFLRPIIS